MSEAVVTVTHMTKEIAYGAKRAPGKTREMVLRHHLSGLSNVQVAKKVGISPQAVGKHLRRLRESGELSKTS